MSDLDPETAETPDDQVDKIGVAQGDSDCRDRAVGRAGLAANSKYCYTVAVATEKALSRRLI